MPPHRSPPAAPHEARDVRLGDSLMHLVRVTLRVFRHEAAVAGVSMPQLMILTWLRRSGPTPSTHWAGRIGTTPSSVSALIDGIVEAGYAKRTHNEHDRRLVLVSLTPKGERAVAEVERLRRRRLRSIFVDVSPRAALEARTLLDDLARQIEAHDLGPVPTGNASRRTRRPATPKTRPAKALQRSETRPGVHA